MKGPDGDAIAGLQSECETLRKQLSEAQSALVRAGSGHALRPSTEEPHLLETAEPDTGPYRRIIEDILQGVAVLTATGRVLHANRRLARLIEADREDLTGEDLVAYLPQPLRSAISEGMDRPSQSETRGANRVSSGEAEAQGLHFTLSRLPSGRDAAWSVVVTNLEQVVDRRLLTVAAQEINEVDTSLLQARAQAESLLESAIAAHSRADAIHSELQREIDSRKRAEAALRETEHRYQRMLDAIGSVRWLSTADWETVLQIGARE